MTPPRRLPKSPRRLRLKTQGPSGRRLPTHYPDSPHPRAHREACGSEKLDIDPTQLTPMGLQTKNRQKQAAELCKQHLRETTGGYRKDRQVIAPAVCPDDAADMLKRRFKQAGLPAHYSPHSSGERTASRIFWKMTAFWKPPSASLATLIAGPPSSDRRGKKVLLEDMERIRY